MSTADARSELRSVPAEVGDGWTLSTPEAVGLNAAVLRGAIGWLDTLPNANIHSLLVARRGALVFEHYRKGSDERWRDPLPDRVHGPATKHDLRSATKSVTGLLVGVALDRKLLRSLNEPVFGFFPKYADLRTPEKDEIRIRHLLTMSSGLEWDENVPDTDPNHGEMRMWRSDDHLRTALEPRPIAAPGLDWNYSGGSTEILGAILRTVTGKPIDEFAREALLGPLGITDVEWARHADDSPSASGGLRMCARDLLKIGWLVAARGQWGSHQIVPAQWIADSIAAQIGCADRCYFYGYQWWLGRSLVNHMELTWAAAMGLGGQRIFVVPSIELVAVLTAGHYADFMQAWLPLVIFNRYVLRALASG